MTRYEDAELISVLPPILSSVPDNAAISYAYKMAMQKIIISSAKTLLYADIDKMDDEILDLMALELRTQYYDESLSKEIKRKLIKNSLGWYQKAGTLGAVLELIRTVFGEGDIVEWFDFTDSPVTPGMFEITTHSNVTEELLSYFTTVIQYVKNTRSHIRRLLILKRVDTKWFIGAAGRSTPNIKILPYINDNVIKAENNIYTAVGIVVRNNTIVLN